MADLLSDFDKEKDLADSFDQEKDLSPEPKYKDAPSLGDRAVQAFDPVHMWHLATASPEAHEDPRESVGRLRALEQGATFGLLGKAAGLQDPERGAQFQKDEEEHPGAAMVGSLAAPVPGFGEAKALGLAGKVGLHAATGAGLQALSNATHDRPLTEGTLPAAVVGGTVGGAAEGLSSPGFKNWLSNKVSGPFATKALGASKALLKGKLGASPEAVADFGNRALDLGLVPALGSAADMQAATHGVLNQAGGKIGQTLEGIQKPFNWQGTRADLENKVLNPMRQSPPLRSEASALASKLGEPGEFPQGMPVSLANKIKGDLGDTVAQFDAPAKAKAAKQAYGQINEAVNQHVQQNATPEALAQFLKAKKDYETAKVAQGLLKNKVRTELGNNYFSPGAVATGEGLGLTGLAEGGGALDVVPKSLAGALAYKMSKEHGPALIANAARGVANMSPVQPKLTPAMLQALQALRNRSSNGGQ